MKNIESKVSGKISLLAYVGILHGTCRSRLDSAVMLFLASSVRTASSTKLQPLSTPIYYVFRKLLYLQCLAT